SGRWYSSRDGSATRWALRSPRARPSGPRMWRLAPPRGCRSRACAPRRAETSRPRSCSATASTSSRAPTTRASPRICASSTRASCATAAGTPTRTRSTPSARPCSSSRLSWPARRNSERAAGLERLQPHFAEEVGVGVGRQDHDVLLRMQELEHLGALGGVALPAVVGERVELVERHLVDHDLEGRCRGGHVLLEARELRGA